MFVPLASCVTECDNPLTGGPAVCHTISMRKEETTMNNQPRWYAVFTGWNKYEVFDLYEDAWTFAQKIYETTGNVIAIETVN